MESIRDCDEALELAKASGKPIMIDFTGWACVNCRKMEEQVWTIPEINKIISEKYVLVSLYVDDREELPEDQKFNFLKPTGGVKKIKTVGDKWATFQTVNFKNNSQPYYILLDTELNLLNKPVGYTPDTEVYRVWLETGLENFNVESKGPN